MKPFIAQLRAEVTMTMTRGESLLLTIGIPVGLLVFFSLVDVLPTGTKDPVTFLAPGVLAMAVLSTAFTGPRDRDRVRAVLPRPQAPRHDAARPATAHRREGHRRACQ